jgi:preprotein translocase subunit YajC
MNTLLLTATGGAMGGVSFWIIYIAFFAVLIYFMAYRPQKKEKQKQQELLSSIAVGDSVLTTSGFYGVIIDMTDDTVIVEFGNNKNCRIPMQKAAIVQVEKPDTAK